MRAASTPCSVSGMSTDSETSNAAERWAPPASPTAIPLSSRRCLVISSTKNGLPPRALDDPRSHRRRKPPPVEDRVDQAGRRPRGSGAPAARLETFHRPPPHAGPPARQLWPRGGQEQQRPLHVVGQLLEQVEERGDLPSGCPRSPRWSARPSPAPRSTNATPRRSPRGSAGAPGPPCPAPAAAAPSSCTGRRRPAPDRA